MKKTFLTLSFLVATLFVSAQTATKAETFDDNAPIFQFEEEVIDYGKIEQNADGNRVFKFTNRNRQISGALGVAKDHPRETRSLESFWTGPVRSK